MKNLLNSMFQIKFACLLVALYLTILMVPTNVYCQTTGDTLICDVSVVVDQFAESDESTGGLSSLVIADDSLSTTDYSTIISYDDSLQVGHCAKTKIYGDSIHVECYITNGQIRNVEVLNDAGGHAIFYLRESSSTATTSYIKGYVKPITKYTSVVFHVNQQIKPSTNSWHTITASAKIVGVRYVNYWDHFWYYIAPGQKKYLEWSGELPYCHVNYGFIKYVIIDDNGPMFIAHSEAYYDDFEEISWPSLISDFEIPINPLHDDLTVVFGIVRLSSIKFLGEELPVELSSFSAQYNSDFVSLLWETQSETSLAGYNIYRDTSESMSNPLKRNEMLITATNSSQTQNYTFNDQEVEPNSIYYYWLESVDCDGKTQLYGPVTATTNNPGEPDTPPVIEPKTSLLCAFPNPFNPDTTIPFELKNASDVRMDIFNIKGELVKNFSSQHYEKAGVYEVHWDGKTDAGQTLSSGVYFYRMTAGTYSATKKVILMK